MRTRDNLLVMGLSAEVREKQRWKGVLETGGLGSHMRPGSLLERPWEFLRQ